MGVLSPAERSRRHRARRGHVEHDGVGGALGVGEEGGLPVLGQLGLEPFEAQRPVEGLADSGFVVDHEDSHAVHSRVWR
jgi:hypothetical protein